MLAHKGLNQLIRKHVLLSEIQLPDDGNYCCDDLLAAIPSPQQPQWLLELQRSPQQTKKRLFRHAALRRQLAWLMQIPPAQLTFCYGNYGKPYLSGRPVNFNYSHSGNTSVLAIAKYPVGVDIEIKRYRKNYRTIGQQCFADGEWQEIQSLGQQAGCERFLTLWTRKEALAKVNGQSLVRVIQQQLNWRQDCEHHRHQNYWFWQHRQKNYRLCLCSRTKLIPLWYQKPENN